MKPAPVPQARPADGEAPRVLGVVRVVTRGEAIQAARRIRAICSAYLPSVKHSGTAALRKLRDLGD